MKLRKLCLTLLIAALCLPALSAAAFADAVTPGDDAKALVLLYGADSEGNNLSGNYWNGFVVEDSEGDQYVIAGSGAYLDVIATEEKEQTEITATAFTDEGTETVEATIYDVSAGVALFKADGDIPGVEPLPIASTKRVKAGDTVKVVGFDWTKLSGAETAAMHSAFVTEIEGTREEEKYTFYTLAEAAPDADWESAAVINDDGYVIGILIFDGDADSFFPMEYVLTALGYDADTAVTKDKDGKGGGGGLVVALLLILAVAAILAYGYIRYRKNVAAGYTPDRKARNKDDGDIPLAMNYQPGERLCIVGISGPYANQKFRINGEVTMGRSTTRCNLPFPDSARGVSYVHCMIRQRGGQLEVKDLGSTRGTFCRGLQVAPNTPVLLSPGERFYLGSPQNTFEVTL